MKSKTRRIAPLLIAGWLAFAPWTQADEIESYGETTGRKALSGLTNMTTSIVEVPKNVINFTNQSNFIFGLGFGGLQGFVNMGGRILVGLSDFILAPLPTQPIVYPLYPWQDFGTDTSYGPIFRLCSPKDNPCIREDQ